jgi:hypothetical protein
MRITEYAFSDEPMSHEDALAIEAYLDLPTCKEALAQIAPSQTITELLNRPRIAKAELTTRRKCQAQAMSNDGLMTLLAVLTNSYEGAALMENGKLRQFDQDDVQPAADEFSARCARGRADAQAEHEAKQAADSAHAREVFAELWREGPVDAREWMAMIIREPDASEHADLVLRTWYACDVAKCRLEEAEGRKSRIKDPVKNAEELEALGTKIGLLKSYLTGNVFDLTPPDCLEDRLIEHFNQLWPAGKQLETVSQKLHAYHDWHPFWQKYGPAYLKARREATEREIEIRKLRRFAGESSGEARRRNRWVEFSQRFTEYAEGEEITSKLIDSFPKQDNVRKEQGVEFLKTLLTARSNLPSYKAMEMTLHGVGIKLDQKTAELCSRIVFEKEIPD